MGQIPNPRYALVGEWTMAKLTFLNAFSWKHGFLVEQSQHISNRNGPQNNVAKEMKKVARIEPTLAWDTKQQILLLAKP